MFAMMVGKLTRIGGARRRRLALGDFARDRRGETAIEFAMVAVPFFGLVCATLETSYVCLQGVLLQKATLSAGRALQTMSVSGAQTLGSFAQSYVCNNLPLMFACSQVQVSLTTLTTGSYSSSSWTTAQTDLTANTYQASGYNSAQSLTIPAAGSLVVLRISYPVSQLVATFAGGVVQNQTLTPIHAGQTQINGGYYNILYGTYAFQVEP
jgi:Flp pilus assembly protein TadG